MGRSHCVSAKDSLDELDPHGHLLPLRVLSCVLGYFPEFLQDPHDSLRMEANNHPDL
jgi:hypothetical protein